MNAENVHAEGQTKHHPNTPAMHGVVSDVAQQTVEPPAHESVGGHGVTAKGVGVGGDDPVEHVMVGETEEGVVQHVGLQGNEGVRADGQRRLVGHQEVHDGEEAGEGVVAALGDRQGGERTEGGE